MSATIAMPAHDYDADKPRAESRRQEAVRKAVISHGAAVQAAMAAPSGRLEENLRVLAQELARAVRRADEDFHKELKALRAKHAVSDGHD